MAPHGHVRSATAALKRWDSHLLQINTGFKSSLPYYGANITWTVLQGNKLVYRLSNVNKNLDTSINSVGIV